MNSTSLKKIFPDEEVVATDHFLVGQDWEVPISGFFIISCKRPMRSMLEFTNEEMSEFTPLLIRVRQAMKHALGIEEVYLFHNEDSIHGFHLWIFPRHAWMEPFGRKIESVRPIIKHAKEHLINDAVIQGIKRDVIKMREQLMKY